MGLFRIPTLPTMIPSPQPSSEERGWVSAKKVESSVCFLSSTWMDRFSIYSLPLHVSLRVDFIKEWEREGMRNRNRERRWNFPQPVPSQTLSASPPDLIKTLS
jgi:hypothetical protein